jgi:hypothetical protein
VSLAGKLKGIAFEKGIGEADNLVGNRCYLQMLSL